LLLPGFCGRKSSYISFHLFIVSLMDEYMAIIKLFAGNFAPQGWHYCDGSLLSIAQYSALYSLLGTTYGGDGQTTFALPDLRGRAAVGAGAGPGLQNYTQGQTGGVENVTLTANQLAAHNHTLMASTTAANADSPSGAVLAQATATTGGGDAATMSTYLTGAAPNTPMANTSIGASGGNQPHENRPPYLALGYIICVEGVYPSRP
jgi:microcystin-dependent protein